MKLLFLGWIAVSSLEDHLFTYDFLGVFLRIFFFLCFVFRCQHRHPSLVTPPPPPLPHPSSVAPYPECCLGYPGAPTACSASATTLWKGRTANGHYRRTQTECNGKREREEWGREKKGVRYIGWHHSEGFGNARPGDNDITCKSSQDCPLYHPVVYRNCQTPREAAQIGVTCIKYSNIKTELWSF